MGKASYRLFIIAFFAILAGSAFSLARPVQVWANDYSGNISSSQFAAGEGVTITGNTNLHINSSVTVHSIDINDNCTLTITGDPGKTLTTTYSITQYNSSGNLTVNSGTINSGGIAVNNLIISGGTITAHEDFGISAYTITISGKNTVINATGDNGYGIQAHDDINISGGKITATGTEGGILSAFKDVTISGNNTVVNATSAEKNGILADNILSISGGKVTAQGNWCGIATENGDMTISGSNTVVSAKSSVSPAVNSNHRLTIDPPLTVTKPAGGGIGGRGGSKFIATVAGGQDAATDVVIKGPVAKSDAGSDSDDESESEKPAVVNKDAIAILKITGFPYGTFFAKQEQGLAAKAAFAASLPAGYKSAFTFNAITNGKSPDNTLKKGSFTLVIPAEFRKAGRTFAITYLDKNGKATTLYDTDNDPNTITVAVNFEGYAFELIYKD